MPKPPRLSKGEMDAWLAESTPAVRATARAARALVHDVLPDVGETAARGDNGLGFGARQYGADGWGIAAISVHRGWVNLGFFRGTELPDPTGALGGTGKRLRHVKLRSADEVTAHRDALSALITAARDVASRPAR